MRYEHSDLCVTASVQEAHWRREVEVCLWSLSEKTTKGMANGEIRMAQTPRLGADLLKDLMTIHRVTVVKQTDYRGL